MGIALKTVEFKRMSNMEKTGKRPYITCHILQSLDGKISGSFFGETSVFASLSIYNRMKEEYQADAIIYGRTTAEQLFAHGKPMGIDDTPAKRENFIADKKAKQYLIVTDPDGSLYWNDAYVTGRSLDHAHVIMLLCESAGDSYLNYLQKMGISYLMCGDKDINLTMAMEMASEIFGIKKALLLGGGLTNGAFAAEDLIDELSLVIVPVLDGSSTVPTLCESGDFLRGGVDPLSFRLNQVKKLKDSGIWLDYLR